LSNLFLFSEDMIDLNNTFSSEIKNLELLAKQVVEGFITGIHKSPFHGFSVEFSEHKLYNKGESTRHIDWKLFGKTEKLYTKKYEEETNLRCHLIIDNSASMHYPTLKKQNLSNLNKIGFSSVAAASLIEILRKQRDAVGLSIYADTYEYYAPEKGSERHRKLLLNQLEKLLHTQINTSSTETYQYLHEIAEKMHRRSLIFLFTDMFQTIHTFDGKHEFDFDFDNTPKKFIDIETNQEINIYTANIQEKYTSLVKEYFNDLKNKCLQYKIDYIPVDINKGFNEILTAYLVSRRKFK